MLRQVGLDELGERQPALDRVDERLPWDEVIRVDAVVQTESASALRSVSETCVAVEMSLARFLPTQAVLWVPGLDETDSTASIAQC